MSKYMQLTVTVNPYYPKSLKETYHKLASHLGYLDSDLVSRDPSLYELVGQFDHLLYRFEGTPLREVLLRHREILLKIHKNVQESMANWNLALVDRLLYEIEDIFDQMESELE
jgi:hypothetical protein